eukprot:824090-Pyramimonas_sp.AAC.2
MTSVSNTPLRPREEELVAATKAPSSIAPSPAPKTKLNDILSFLDEAESLHEQRYSARPAEEMQTPASVTHSQSMATPKSRQPAPRTPLQPNIPPSALPLVPVAKPRASASANAADPWEQVNAHKGTSDRSSSRHSDTASIGGILHAVLKSV